MNMLTRGRRSRPMYAQLNQRILNDIKSGQYRHGDLIPSERDLCLKYAVSRQTIRNALTKLVADGWLAPQPGKGTFVQVPPKPGGAHPPAAVAPPSQQVGWIYSMRTFVDDPAMHGFLLGIKSVLSQGGYSLSLSVSRRDSKHGVVPCYREWVRHRTMAGYILHSVEPRLQKQFQRWGVPVVCLGYLWEDADLPNLALDFRKIYRLMVEHLHQQGHRNIVAVVKHSDTTFRRECLQGFREGMAAHGATRSDRQIEDFDDTPYALTTVLRRILRRKPRPTSVLLAGDDHLEHVMPILETLGVRVPEDLHITALQAKPSRCPFIDRLCYFDYDAIGLGRRAAEKMIEILARGETHPRHELFDAGWIVDPVAAAPAARP